MQIIKKTILTVIFFCFTIGNSYSQKVSDTKDKPFYWFLIELYEYEWKDGILLLNVNGNIINGELKEFKKQIKKELKKSKILVGPFSSEEEAKNAAEIYNSDYNNIKDKTDKVDKEYIFFKVQVKEKNNTGIFKLTKQKTNINVGTQKSFKAKMTQNMKDSYITVGPFYPETILSNSKLLKSYSKHLQ